MKPARRILAVLLGAALLLGSLCACGKTAGTGTEADTNTENSVAQQLYDADVTAPDLTNATEITLSETDDVTITSGGVYVLTGALTMLSPAHETFELFTQLYGVEYIIPENATFATAIGAALYSMRRDG